MNHSSSYQTHHPSMNRPKILVVEDDETNRVLIKEILELTDFSADYAINGQECLEKMETHEFDLILMDIQMPIMDGIQATQKLRGDKRFEKIPIVAVTANAIEQEKEYYFEVGINDWVSKPIVVKTLLAVIEKWLGAYQKKTKPEPESNEYSQLTECPAKEIDITAALENLDGDARAYLDILSVFKKAHGEDIKQMNVAIQSGKGEQAQFILHSLRGALGTVGANSLQQIVNEMYTLLKSGQELEKELLRQFEISFAECLSEIENILLNANISYRMLGKNLPLGTASVVELQPKIERLKELLDLYATDSEYLLIEIIEETNNKEFREQLDMMLNQVKIFEFETALNLLEQYLNHRKE